MELASRSQGLSLPKNLRPKQKEIIDAFAADTEVIAQLPTGYGKTRAAAGAFAQLMYRGVCNRVLYVVPRRGQADQAAEDMPDNLRDFGIETDAIIVGDDAASALTAHAQNKWLVFVVTVQSLLSRGTWSTIRTLMATGKWFVVIDEHHHYSSSDEGKWTAKIKALNHCALLAMSATANRHDGSDHFPDPQIVETYVNAAVGKYVKRLSLHAYHYTIDAVTVDGKLVRYTTEDLAREVGSDSPEAVDAYITSKKMRFSPKYISPLITFPIERIVDNRSQGIRSQMIVQAMSCWHAKCIVDQIKLLIPDGFTVDWVGTGPAGRADKENTEVLKRFCPPKDKATKRRPWTLDVLVNVGIAGEGLDTMDVSEVTFLTSGHVSISLKQTIGRAARTNEHDIRGHINVETGSPLAEWAWPKNVEHIFDSDIPPPKEDDGDDDNKKDPSEYEELPERLGWVIADMSLIDIRSEPLFKEIFQRTRKGTDLARTDEDVAKLAEKVLRDYLNRSNNKSAIYAQKREQIEAGLSKIAGLVIRRISQQGMMIERTLAGDIRRRINTRKKMELGAISEADGDEALDRHWEWIKNLERAILQEHGLMGVPQWLR